MCLFIVIIVGSGQNFKMCEVLGFNNMDLAKRAVCETVLFFWSAAKFSLGMFFKL